MTASQELNPRTVTRKIHPTKQVLVVGTSQAAFPNGRPTGLWMNEFAIPFERFSAEGIAVTVASPNGGRIPVDPRSKADFIRHAVLWFEATQAIQHSIKLRVVNTEHYDALFIPGGHGPMFDLANNKDLQRIIREFYESGKIIAALCHGVAGLVKATLSNGGSIVAGKRLTGYTDLEEQLGRLEGELPFSLESELRKSGADFVANVPALTHVEKDGNLITGQNPESSAKLAQAIIAALHSS